MNNCIAGSCSAHDFMLSGETHLPVGIQELNEDHHRIEGKSFLVPGPGLDLPDIQIQNILNAHGLSAQDTTLSYIDDPWLTPITGRWRVCGEDLTSPPLSPAAAMTVNVSPIHGATTWVTLL